MLILIVAAQYPAISIEMLIIWQQRVLHEATLSNCAMHICTYNHKQFECLLHVQGEGMLSLHNTEMPGGAGHTPVTVWSTPAVYCLSSP